MGQKIKGKAKIIVVNNQKGGVGKSAIAFHLAYAAAQQKKNAKVLCLDLDSQGNLSQDLTGDLDIINDTQGGIGLLLEGKPFTPSKSTNSSIDLLHGHKELDRYDKDEVISDRCCSADMKKFLHELDYDYIIIDTPPAPGDRQLIALCWADVLVVPTMPVMKSITAFQNVLGLLNEIVSDVNPGMKWFCVINMANMSVKSHREKESFLREEYGSQILATLTNRSAVSDAMEEEPAQPVWLRKRAPTELREQWLKLCQRIINS